MVPIKRVVADMPKCSGAVSKPVKNNFPLKGKITVTYNEKDMVFSPELMDILLKAICNSARKSNPRYCPQTPKTPSFPDILKWVPPRVLPPPHQRSIPVIPRNIPLPFHRWRTEPPVILHWNDIPWHRCCPASNTTEAFFSFLERLKKIFPTISAGEAMGMWTYIEKRDHCELHHKPIIELC